MIDPLASPYRAPETDFERRVQSHLVTQVQTFGSTLVDTELLSQLAGGGGSYACRGSEEAAFWLAEDYGWRAEFTPPPQTRLMVPLPRRCIRLYDPVRFAGWTLPFHAAQFYRI